MATGCNTALLNKSAGLATASRVIADLIAAGGTVPTSYTINGVAYPVVIGLAAGLADDSTDRAATLNSAISGAAAGAIVVVAPASRPYVFASEINIQAGKALVGYGATLRATTAANRQIEATGDDVSVLGLRLIGPDASDSDWTARWSALARTVEPSKDSALSAAGASWLYAIGHGNLIFRDCHTLGGRGGVRAFGGTNILVEGCEVFGCESDGIHFERDITNLTVRKNTVYGCGDDLIAIVSADKYAHTTPTNILVEDNAVSFGRARGITIHGGSNVTIRRNTVCHTLRSAVYLSAEVYAGEASHDVVNVDIRDNSMIGAGLLRQAQPDIGWVCALAYALGQTSVTKIDGVTQNPAVNSGAQIISGITLANNRCAYDTDNQYDPAISFFRSSPSSDGGVSAPTTSGTVISDRTA